MEFTPTTEIPSKYVFAVKSKTSAKMQGNHKMCYHLCFKHMLRLQAPLVLGPEDHKIKEMCEFCEIWWVLSKIVEIVEIC